MNPACPACSSASTSIQLPDVTCFECPGCEGHFIPGEELERFLNERDAPQRFIDLMNLASNEPRSRRQLTCPSCRTKSFRVVRTCFIEVDLCATCVGMYLDRGEAEAYVLRTRASTRVLEQARDNIDRLLDEITNVMDV